MNDEAKLYLCPTPIGNMGDISLRTLEVLEKVDLIACEDTRVSIKLLSHFNIKKPLFSYHEHNEHEASQKLVEQLKEGKKIALITDAGMPGISDPGETLAGYLIKENIPFTVLPGASAILTALILSGLSARRFVYEGFLPRKGQERKDILASWENERRTIVFYEAPHRLEKTLEELARLFPKRSLAVARELSKKFEETIRGTTNTVYEHFLTHPIKGEFVLILGAALEESEENRLALALKEAHLLIEKGEKTKEVAGKIAKAYKLSKRDIYQNLITKNN